jgi:hypothetical protein
MKRGWESWEKDSAHDLGLVQTISSGNKFYDPGDAVGHSHDPFPLYSDAKYTERMSYGLRRVEMENHILRADEQGKRMVLPVRIWPRGDHLPLDLVVVQMADFAELYELALQYMDLRDS